MLVLAKYPNVKNNKKVQFKKMINSNHRFQPNERNNFLQKLVKSTGKNIILSYFIIDPFNVNAFKNFN